MLTHRFNSTSIDEASYIPDQSELILKFKPSGKRYSYQGVESETYYALTRAPSAGQYFNQNIRGIYMSERISQ